MTGPQATRDPKRRMHFERRQVETFLTKAMQTAREARTRYNAFARRTWNTPLESAQRPTLAAMSNFADLFIRQAHNLQHHREQIFRTQGDLPQAMLFSMTGLGLDLFCVLDALQQIVGTIPEAIRRPWQPVALDEDPHLPYLHYFMPFDAVGLLRQPMRPLEELKPVVQGLRTFAPALKAFLTLEETDPRAISPADRLPILELKFFLRRLHSFLYFRPDSDDMVPREEMVLLHTYDTRSVPWPVERNLFVPGNSLQGHFHLGTARFLLDFLAAHQR